MRRKNPVNTHRERMKRYPYGYEPPELDGAKYLDLCPEFLGEDELFADLPENPTRFPPYISPAPKASKTDPLGSYTGVPLDSDTPTQDADDL